MKDLSKIEEIYHAVLEKSPAEREAFLKESCGDDEDLRREVESLLSFDERAEDFIESPPGALAEEFLGDGEKNDNLSGRKFSHYRVLEQIGAGGMGEVYLAEDTRLGRKVALKLLPAQFSENPERKARFEKEARAASALNHPNIITIYGIEEAENLNFIATEFIDGQTLRTLINEKPFNWRETVEITIQITSALEAAHSVGIVHRDIKPANIMIRRDGYVKVLDFGLAKLQEGEKGRKGDGELKNTLSSVLTNPGMVMGTVAYMSPEQARGLKTDAQTDIWSLGVVLYEMLSGKQPFTGETASHIIVSILEKEPLPLENVLEELQKIIGKALTKDKKTRYRTAQDLLIDLKKLKRTSESQDETSDTPNKTGNENETRIYGAASTQQGETAKTQPTVSSLEYAVTQAKSHKLATIVVAVLLFGIISTAVYWNYFYRQNPSQNPFQSVKFDRVTAHGLTITNAISPDGKYVVYAKDESGEQSLWLRQTATSGDTQIIPSSQMNYHFLNFSPDGENIYFVGVEKEGVAPALFEVSTLGRNQRKLIDGVNSQISFAPDGKSLAFLRRSEGENKLIIANAQGRDERVLATRKFPDLYTRGVSWSPDGKLIAVATLKSRSRYAGGIAVVDVATGAENPIPLSEKEVIQVTHLAWLKDGSGLVFCRYVSPTGERFQLQFVAYPSGQIQNITNDLTSYEDLSLTADGKTLVSVQREYSMGIWLTDEGDFTKTKQIETKTGRDDGERGIAWTKDGKIVYVSSEDEAQNIWRVDADGTNQKPLTTGNEHGKVNPSLNPDDGTLIYLSDLEKVSIFGKWIPKGKTCAA
jgi:serine/threonine protein kinase